MSQKLSLGVEERRRTWEIRCLLRDHRIKKEWVHSHHILKRCPANLHLWIMPLILKKHLIEKLGLEKLLLEVHNSRNKRVLLVRDLWTRKLLRWQMKLNIDVLKLIYYLWWLRSATIFFDSRFICLCLLAASFHLCSINFKWIQKIIRIEQILTSK